MPIRGTIDEGGIIDIIQMIALGMKTGVLNVTDNFHLGAIYFENGKIVYCSIVNKEEKLGDLLLKKGDITEEQLKECLKIQEDQPDKKIGDILIDKGYISQDKLEKALKEQIEDSLFTILTWKEGKFNFEPGIKPHDTEILVSMDVDRILLKEGKKIDEWSIIQQYIPSFDNVPEKTGKVPTNLLKDEEKVFSLIDSRHSVEDIIEETNIPRFSVAKILVDFIKNGYIKIGDKRKIHVDKDLKKQLEESLKLSFAFFAAEMYKESLEKINEVLSLDPLHIKGLFHRSRLYIILGEYDKAEKDIQLCVERGMDDWFVFNSMGVIYEKKKEFLLAEENYLKSIAKCEEKYRGMVYANLGINAYKNVRFQDAIKYFNRAMELGYDTPSVILFYSNALVHLGEYKEAVDMLNKGIVKYPSSWQLHYTLGVILESVGANVQSEIAYKQAARFATDNDIRPFLALGNYYYKRREWDESVKWYERVIEIKKDSEIFLKLGNIAFQRGDMEKAKKWWLEVLNIDKNNTKAKKNLTFLLGKYGTGK